jgi:hypothetical protein
MTRWLVHQWGGTLKRSSHLGTSPTPAEMCERTLTTQLASGGTAAERDSRHDAVDGYSARSLSVTTGCGALGGRTRGIAGRVVRAGWVPAHADCGWAGTVLREFGCLRSVSDDAGVLERERDLALGLGRQWQQRRAYGGVLELAALDEGQLECDGSFHV